MSGDITQRLMDSAEEANDDIADKSFHHTIQSESDHALDTLTNSTLETQYSQGSDVHDMLMERAREKAHLESTLGQGNQFFDYKNSSVGGIGGDREIRRELSLRSREERRAREQRFGHRKQRPSERDKDTNTNDRQRYNATGATDGDSRATGTRQEFNSQAPESRTTFREPPARGYNPYA